MVKPGTTIKVRDNEPDSVFGPLYDCTIAHYHPEIGITVKHANRNIICIDIEKHSPTLSRKLMDYIIRHAECGSIINLGTIRQMQIEHASQMLGYHHSDVALSLQKQTGSPACAFSETHNGS